MDKIYVLTCTYEDRDCIRETIVLCVSQDKEYLRQKLREHVKKDYDGLFAKHGFASNDPDYVSSVWDDYDGFEEYEIRSVDFYDVKPEVFKADDLGAVLEV